MSKLCTATHPKQPNFSGNARGRKLHLTSEKPNLTKCNMRVDEVRSEKEWSYTVFEGEGRRCKICFAQKIENINK